MDVRLVKLRAGKILCLPCMLWSGISVSHTCSRCVSGALTFPTVLEDMVDNDDKMHLIFFRQIQERERKRKMNGEAKVITAAGIVYEGCADVWRWGSVF